MSAETELKLSEAEYFFECMKENRHKNEVFIYNLSAFVTAYRSITLLMQKEFKRMKGFDEWYKNKKDSMKKIEFMKLLRDKRNITLKQESLKPNAHVKAEIKDTIILSESIKFTVYNEEGEIIERKKVNSNGKWVDITKEDSQKKLNQETAYPKNEQVSNNEMKLEWDWSFEEYSDIDLFEICQECLDIISKIVQECISLFKVEDLK
jgi:hypothetical protein